MSSILIFCILILFVCLLLIALKFCLRHRFPVSVSCWFCGEKTKVLYDNRNCWDCPSCEQYNGFDQDGNYNKPIPAQHDERLNHPITCQEDEFIAGDNVFCDRCTQNQLLKIKQLANFVPYNEKNYDQEVEAFKRHIEKVYNLCLTCEKKVEQTLRHQDEAISKRLYQSQFDHSRSFLDNTQEEQAFLHSSYTDRRINKLIVASLVLHTVSVVCSLLVATKEISLDGDQTWQKHLLFIYPLLLWLDRNAISLAVIGLFSCLIAKLCLGKYRLHIIDAVSCPVWLLVLLSQTGFLTLHETGSPYHICNLVLNVFTSATCLGIYRHRRDKPNHSMIKMSFNNSVSGTSSGTCVFSPIKQTDERSRSEDQRSEVESRGQVTSTTDPEQTGVSSTVAEHAEDFDDNILSGHTAEDLKNSNHQTSESVKESYIDDTATVLNSFSLGGPTLKRNNSGVFSTVSFGNFTSNLGNQSVSQSMHSRKQGRSLLSPPTFTHESSVDSHRSSPVPRYGLFSAPASQTPSCFSGRSSSVSRPSAFTPTKFFSSERHSFTPERPASPVVTSFGESPFYNVPTQSDSHSQFSSFGTHTGSFAVAKDSGSVAKGFSSFSKQFQRVSRKRLDMAENSDSEDDNFSEITSISRRYSPNKNKERQVNKAVPWWKSAGFIGFILGGSVVANLIFTTQMWFNNTR